MQCQSRAFPKARLRNVHHRLDTCLFLLKVYHRIHLAPQPPSPKLSSAAHSPLNTLTAQWLPSECWHLEQIPCWLNHGKYCVSFVHHIWTWLMLVVVIHHCCEGGLPGWRALCSNLSSLYPRIPPPFSLCCNLQPVSVSSVSQSRRTLAVVDRSHLWGKGSYNVTVYPL